MQRDRRDRAGLIVWGIVLWLLAQPSAAQPDPLDSTAQDDAQEVDVTTPSRFMLDLGISSGFSFHDSLAYSGLLDTGHYDSRGVQVSTNVLTPRLSGRYLVTERLSISFDALMGIIAVKESGTQQLRADNLSFGIGDVRLGSQWLLFLEDARRPKLYLTTSANTGTSNYSSLGDGLPALGVGVEAQRTLSDRITAVAGLGLTHKFDSGEVKPGDVADFSAGAAFLTPTGSYVIPIRLHIAFLAKSQIALEDFDARTDFMLSFGLARAGSRYVWQGYVYAPGGNVNLEESSMGSTLSVPLYPRERFREGKPKRR